jgi:2-C-methyl-D-erythritol 4-phosphate cytidylyltransferase
MSETSSVVAVILCAGQGTRMGAGRNKVFLPLRGKPLLVHTIEAFVAAEKVGSILLVAHPQEVAYCEDEIVERYGLARVRGVIAGGATRHQSEERALAMLQQEIETGTVEVVLIHDGARPLVTPEQIGQVIAAARATGGALLATPVTASEVVAHLCDDGMVGQIYPVGELWRAQTPQAFLAARLLNAYDAARETGFEGTDTAASYERLGYAVQVVAGSEANLKVTTPEDLARAEALLRDGEGIASR